MKPAIEVSLVFAPSNWSTELAHALAENYAAALAGLEFELVASSRRGPTTLRRRRSPCPHSDAGSS